MKRPSILSEDSGQAMTEYVIVSAALVFGTVLSFNSLAFSGSEIFDITTLYQYIHLMLRGMMTNVAIPIP